MCKIYTGKHLFPSPSRVPCLLENEGFEQEGIHRQPIFIPSTWRAGAPCDVSAYWIPDTGTIVPSVSVQVTSQQMVDLGKVVVLFWDLVRTREFIPSLSSLSVSLILEKHSSFLDSVKVLRNTCFIIEIKSLSRHILAIGGVKGFVQGGNALCANGCRCLWEAKDRKPRVRAASETPTLEFLWQEFRLTCCLSSAGSPIQDQI